MHFLSQGKEAARKEIKQANSQVSRPGKTWPRDQGPHAFARFESCQTNLVNSKYHGSGILGSLTFELGEFYPEVERCLMKPCAWNLCLRTIPCRGFESGKDRPTSALLSTVVSMESWAVACKLRARALARLQRCREIPRDPEIFRLVLLLEKPSARKSLDAKLCGQDPSCDGAVLHYDCMW